VLLSPFSFLKYSAMFRFKEISYEILDPNIQTKINEQEMSILKRTKSANSSIIFKYARYQEIMDFIGNTVTENPKIASSYIAGKTDEGRDLKVIVLNPTVSSTRSIWIDCGIHAREWVSPPTCVYAIDTLVKEFKSGNPKTVAIFEKYQIHIMPLLNPDGYEYSHQTYRLWRKNKKINVGSSCLGVDLNRNYGYRWMTGGASSDPCSETYAGKSQDSEAETKAVINALKQREGNWDIYFNVHSYGNWWLLPYGHSYSVVNRPADYDEMMTRAKLGADAIKSVNGQSFTVGASSDMLYISSGSSADYAKAALGIKYSYVLELRPGKNTYDSRFGFVMPESFMPLIAPETFNGMKEFFYSLV